MIAVVLVTLAVLALAYGVVKREAHWKSELAGAVRQGEDRLAEKQKERDLAVTATFVKILGAFGKAEFSADDPAYKTLADVAENETAGVKNMLDGFREKVAILDAATKSAQDRVAQAAREVQNICAENTLHRTLLEKALTLPLDTPDAHRQLFLNRCNAVLDSPRATYDCPSDDVWTMYVEKHKKRAEGVSLR